MGGRDSRVGLLGAGGCAAITFGGRIIVLAVGYIGRHIGAGNLIFGKE